MVGKLFFRRFHKKSAIFLKVFIYRHVSKSDINGSVQGPVVQSSWIRRRIFHNFVTNPPLAGNK